MLKRGVEKDSFSRFQDPLREFSRKNFFIFRHFFRLDAARRKSSNRTNRGWGLKEEIFEDCGFCSVI